jgi:hypothetical protein
MTHRSKVSVTLFLALSAIAATGFADMATPAAPGPQVVDIDAHALHPAPQVEPQVAPAPVEPAPAVPPVDRAAAPDIEHYSLPLTVVAPRPSEDELLRNAVVDRLATDPRLAGKIGVESYRHVVSLTGRVTTPAQAERAEAIARGIDGVRDVNNYLTTRVGRI